MYPHFTLNRPASQTIARAKAAIGGDEKLWHDEQGDALDALRSTRDFRKNQVNDILCEIMLSG